MNPLPTPSTSRCLNCGLEDPSDPCPRCGRPRVLPLDYLSRMEDLARQIVRAAAEEDSFDLFSQDEAGKTRLQVAITRAAWQLLYWHYPEDGCLGHDPGSEPE